MIASREEKYGLDLEAKQTQVSLSFRVINNQSVFPIKFTHQVQISGLAGQSND